MEMHRLWGTGESGGVTLPFPGGKIAATQRPKMPPGLRWGVSEMGLSLTTWKRLPGVTHLAVLLGSREVAAPAGVNAGDIVAKDRPGFRALARCGAR